MGAVYISGHMPELEKWALQVRQRNLIRFLDLGMRQGGLVEGRRLTTFLSKYIVSDLIENMPIPFAAVATDYATGREIWLRKGMVLDAVRASISMPGLFTPVAHEGRWLLDGGLVNPVPVSICRALGADFIIGVNLNADVLSQNVPPVPTDNMDANYYKRNVPEAADDGGNSINTDSWLTRLMGKRNVTPGLLEVVGGAVNIMQDRITRSRAAGEPPEVMLAPKLGGIGMFEFDRAEECIVEGISCVDRMISSLHDALKTKINAANPSHDI